VFAPRGGAQLAPENTMAAFDNAAALAVDGFELDVRLSKDGEVVVMHDEHLDRTTDAIGPVSLRTAAQLAALDAGFRFQRDRGDVSRAPRIGVPRLADVLARHPHLPAIIELKGTDVAIAHAAVDVVRQLGALDRVCFGGFDDGVLRAAELADPGVCRSAARTEVRIALYKSYVAWPLGRHRYAAFQIPETFGTTRVVSRRFLNAARRAGVLVQVWTVNEEADMRRLIDWGVDALITDRPDLALAVVADRSLARGRSPGIVDAPASARGR
jgi:glycerophosphoryl diester phosphodiesterase